MKDINEVLQTVLPDNSHSSLYEIYEITTPDRSVKYFEGPLWAALLFLRLETCQLYRRLTPMPNYKKGT